MANLKPCPFCGGKAVIKARDKSLTGMSKYYSVGCDGKFGYCRGNVFGSPYYLSEEQAIDQWNEREDGDGDGMQEPTDEQRQAEKWE